MINLYSIRPTINKNVNAEKVMQRSNCDTDSNDDINPYGVIIDELE